MIVASQTEPDQAEAHQRRRALSESSPATATATEGLVIDAAGLCHRDLNQRVRAALDNGTRAMRLVNVCGQRYLGAGLRGDVRLEIEGVPGNDLACFMDGPTIIVRGDAQDGVANTMNQGKVVIHGYAGDVLGYGMRGGQLFVRGNVGYRVGIHMKEYKRQVPVIIAGGTAGDFFGEYMAGGILVLLGLERQQGAPLVGDHCGTGMHGGVIYLRGELPNSNVAREQVDVSPTGEDDLRLLRPHLEVFCAEFGLSFEQVLTEPYWRLKPVSHRPYGSKYAV